MNKNDFQPISEIGFPNLIKKFESYTGIDKSDITKGIGDDAAVFETEENQLNLVSSEIFLEGVHFDLTYHPFKHLGYKVVTSAVSDVYAMNGSPTQLLVNVALPNAYSVQMVEQLYEGIDAACKDYGIQLTGGDTTASHQLLAISVTALGSVGKEQIVYRSGAKNSDAVCVSGDLGAALAGLRILMREKKEWKEKGEDSFQPDLEKYEYVVSKQLVPAARKDIVNLLDENNIRPTSMIDLTQGLISDVRSVAASSNLGVQLHSPAIPIMLDTRNVADEMAEDVDKYAFYGGEDYELLFTLNEKDVNSFSKICDDFTVIGKMTNEFSQIKINTGENKTIEIDV
jgi:thiamine-monophosphate kinase